MSFLGSMRKFYNFILSNPKNVPHTEALFAGIVRNAIRRFSVTGIKPFGPSVLPEEDFRCAVILTEESSTDYRSPGMAVQLGQKRKIEERVT
jgi:hypothetical protein